MASSADCAREVLDAIPLMMRTIKDEMRRHRGPDLSVVHFRSLALLHRRPGISLSEVAEHVGLTLPSTSKTIDNLVDRRFVARETSAGDRRRVDLALTPKGKAFLAKARSAAQSRLAELLGPLSGRELGVVVEAMLILRRVFPSIPSEGREARS